MVCVVRLWLSVPECAPRTTHNHAACRLHKSVVDALPMTKDGRLNLYKPVDVFRACRDR